MPNILIEDISNVIIDGKNCNDAFAACREKPEIAAEIESACVFWSMSRTSDVQNLLSKTAAAAADADTITALKTELAASKAEFTAYKEAASKGADMIYAVISDSTVDDATTVATITQIVAYAAKVANATAVEREIAALDAEIADAQERRKALTV